LYSQDRLPGFFFLVDASDYSALPVRREDSDDDFQPEGAIPPVHTSIDSFHGKSIGDVVNWLKDMPSIYNIYSTHFIVLDDNSDTNDTITICRRYNPEYPCAMKPGEVQFFPYDAETAGNLTFMAYGESFDERLDEYQIDVRYTRVQDLSRGTPSSRISPFLSLPRELRIKIYKLLLISPESVPVYDHQRDDPYGNRIVESRVKRGYARLASVTYGLLHLKNRVVHAEATAVFYHHNTFFIRHLQQQSSSTL
jgi:hypothetical protein